MCVLKWTKEINRMNKSVCPPHLSFPLPILQLSFRAPTLFKEEPPLHRDLPGSSANGLSSSRLKSNQSRVLTIINRTTRADQQSGIGQRLLIINQ